MTWLWQWSKSLTLAVVLVWHRISSRKHLSRSSWHLVSWDWSDLHPEEQQLCLPNQLAHDPDSWTDLHLLQLKMEYEVLVNNYWCKVQEMYTTQDHPPPPSEFLLLPPLDSLYKTYVQNQELPQPGDSRPVMSPSQHALSQKMMKNWIPWKTNIRKSNNSRMLQ